MINYEGLFFQGEELEKILALEKNKLDCVNDIIHCTFKYKPTKEECNDEIIGKYFDIMLCGYASDKNNSGFIILVDKKLEKYYKNTNNEGKIIPPHITCSISKESQASETGKMTFELLEKPVLVKGRYGYYINDDNGKSYVSYEPFNIKK